MSSAEKLTCAFQMTAYMPTHSVLAFELSELTGPAFTQAGRDTAHVASHSMLAAFTDMHSALVGAFCINMTYALQMMSFIFQLGGVQRQSLCEVFGRILLGFI